MKGEKAENIKGPYSTLSNDKLPTQTFDYMISNPPYGRDWETDEDEVKAEAELDSMEDSEQVYLVKVMVNSFSYNI